MKPRVQNPRMSLEWRWDVWERLNEGQTLTDVARALGKHRQTIAGVRDWLRGRTEAEVDRVIANWVDGEWLRPYWLSLRSDAEHDSAEASGASRPRPDNLLQALCEAGDHQWMADERFEGRDYTSEPAPLYVPFEGGGGGYVVPRTRRTCWRCGYAGYFGIG